MARPMKPLVRGGGFYPSRKWTPLVYAGGYTTANGGEEPTPPPIEKTIIGNPIHILDALAKPVQALSVKLEPIQAGSGDPSPTNIRPISGWTGAMVTRTGINVWDEEWESGTYSMSTGAPTASAYNIRGKHRILVLPHTNYYGNNLNIRWLYFDGNDNFISSEYGGNRVITTPNNCQYMRIFFGDSYGTTYKNDISINYPSTDTDYHSGADNTTYSITFPSSAGTVYGGTLDVTQGKLTVDKVAVTIDGNNIKFNQITQYGTLNRFGFAYPSGLSAKYSGNTTYCIADKFTPSFNNTIGITRDRPEGYYCFPHSSAFFVSMPSSTITSIAEANAWAGDNTPKVVYELATPLTIQLTAQQVELLQGENNLFSDGEMTLVYLADGNASDVEALNILLGGRYVNNHTEGEPTDREALDIVLGGKK